MNEKASGAWLFLLGFVGAGGDGQCFYFGDGSIFRLLCWGVAPSSKSIGDGPIKMAPSVREGEGKKKL